ncbi:hypothetical protein [Bradyrhizobium erythrophlei]|uniref:hypothetical protein n=1 Tax=Bradyrhizobium erythrophlei TaxID=1437360 RepID=UPI0012EB9B0D|nr:hypothetical protein [Bradyrhizobium erythrophlei]
MGIEWVAVGIVLVAGALFFGFPIGLAVGYAWRDRISRARRIRFLAEQEQRRWELNAANTAFAGPDGRSDNLVREITARSLVSDQVIAEEPDVSQATISRVRRKAAGPNDQIAKPADKDGKRRNVPTKSKLKVMTSDVPQKSALDRTSMERQP